MKLRIDKTLKFWVDTANAAAAEQRRATMRRFKIAHRRLGKQLRTARAIDE